MTHYAQHTLKLITTLAILAAHTAYGTGSDNEFPQREAWQIRRTMMEKWLHNRIQEKKQALLAAKAGDATAQHIISPWRIPSAVQLLLEKDAQS